MALVVLFVVAVVVFVVFVPTKVAGYYAAARLLRDWFFEPGRDSGMVCLAWGFIGAFVDVGESILVAVAAMSLDHPGAGARATWVPAYLALVALRAATWLNFLWAAQRASSAPADTWSWIPAYSVAGAVWSSLVDLVGGALTAAAYLALVALLMSISRA